MKRRLFDIFCVPLLLLFVAVLVLWGRSYWVGEGFCWRIGEGEYVAIGSLRGGLWLSRGTLAAGVRLGKDPRGYDRGPVEHYMDGDPAELRWSGLGFRYYRQDGGRIVGWSRAVRVPVWSLAVASGGVATFGFGVDYRARRRERKGSCVACGYDLRATPERCPECGEANAVGSA